MSLLVVGARISRFQSDSEKRLRPEVRLPQLVSSLTTLCLIRSCFFLALQTCACLSTRVNQVRLSVFFQFWKDVLIPLDSLGLKPVIVVCFSSDEQIHEVLNQAVVFSLPNSNPSVGTLQRGVVVCLHVLLLVPCSP